MFVDAADCANVFSIMLLFVKKWSSCIDNGDSIVIINTNHVTANIGTGNIICICIQYYYTNILSENIKLIVLVINFYLSAFKTLEPAIYFFLRIIFSKHIVEKLNVSHIKMKI